MSKLKKVNGGELSKPMCPFVSGLILLPGQKSGQLQQPGTMDLSVELIPVACQGINCELFQFCDLIKSEKGLDRLVEKLIRFYNKNVILLKEKSEDTIEEICETIKKEKQDYDKEKTPYKKEDTKEIDRNKN